MEDIFTLKEVRQVVSLAIQITTGTSNIAQQKDEVEELHPALQAVLAMELTKGMINALTQRARKAEKENKTLREKFSQPNISLFKDGKPMDEEEGKAIRDILRDFMNDSAES